jgi:hypothetical protein
MAFSCWLISEESRAMLLARFPPKFPDVIAHHITSSIGNIKFLNPPPEATIKVIGYSTDDEGLEALVVSIDDTQVNSNGKIFHITWSLDRNLGYKPMHSANIIAEFGWQPIDPIQIKGIPSVFN